MRRKTIWHLGGALALALTTFAAGEFILRAALDVGPVDEFGRNAVGAMLSAVGNSLLSAFGTAGVALALPIIVAYIGAVSRSEIIARLIHGVTRTLDVIPLFLWVAIAYVALGATNSFLMPVAIMLIAFPYVLGLCLPTFRAIAAAPFSQNARASRTPTSIRIWRHFLPNALPVLAYPFASFAREGTIAHRPQRPVVFHHRPRHLPCRIPAAERSSGTNRSPASVLAQISIAEPGRTKGRIGDDDRGGTSLGSLGGVSADPRWPAYL